MAKFKKSELLRQLRDGVLSGSVSVGNKPNDPRRRRLQQAESLPSQRYDPDFFEVTDDGLLTLKKDEVNDFLSGGSGSLYREDLMHEIMVFGGQAYNTSRLDASYLSGPQISSSPGTEEVLYHWILPPNIDRTVDPTFKGLFMQSGSGVSTFTVKIAIHAHEDAVNIGSHSADEELNITVGPSPGSNLDVMLGTVDGSAASLFGADTIGLWVIMTKNSAWTANLVITDFWIRYKTKAA